MSDPSIPIEDEPLARIPGLPESELAAARAESGNLGNSEASSFATGDSREELAEKAARNEAGRNERFRDHFEKIAVGGLYLAAIVLAGIALVWIWHMISPCCWRWLEDEDLSHIQSIVTTGLLVGVIGTHFKKRLG